MKKSRSGLAQKHCVPCSGGVPPLRGAEMQQQYDQLDSGWKIIAEHHLEKSYLFDDFKQALAFTNRVGEVAEKEGHHPDIALSWGKVTLTLYTHKINGLTESDFILAAKADTQYKPALGQG